MKKILIPLSFMVLGHIANAQEWYDFFQEGRDKNFLSINQSFLSDSTQHTRGKSKEYLKWTRSVANELDQNGNIVSKEQQFERLRHIHKEKRAAILAPDWRPFLQNRLSPKIKDIPRNKGLARLNRIYVSPQDERTLYAATGLAGLWQSRDQGNSWKDLTSSKVPVTGVWAVAEHPEKSKIILLGDNYTMYRSGNFGRTWKKVTDTTSLVRDIYFDHRDPDRVYAASENGVYRSEDTGKTWEKLLVIKANAMRMHPTDPKTIYVTEIVDHEVKIWVTTNGGESFDSYSLPEYEGRKVGRTRLEVTKAAPGNVYLVTNNMESFGFGALYISKNKGKHWEFISKEVDGGPYSVETPNVLGYAPKGDQEGGQLNWCFAFAVSQADPNEMYVAGVSMWKSSDGGKSWQNHSSWYPNRENLDRHIHADIHDIYAQGDHVFVAHDGGISFSNDRSNTFTDRTAGINALEILGFDINFHVPGQMVNASMHVGSMFYETGAGGWFSMGGADDNYCGFGINDSKHFIHGANYVYNKAAWESGIENIENITTLPPKEPNGVLGVHTENHQLLFQGLVKYNGTVDNNGSTLYRSTDFGETWQLVLKDSLHSDDGRGHNARAYASKSKVVSCWNNTDHLYYKNGGRIYESLDMGLSWEIIHDFNTSKNERWLNSRVYKSRVLDIAVDPANDNVLYVTMRNMFNSKTIMRSTDGGRSWSDFSQGIPQETGRVNSIVIQRGTHGGMYVGTYRGVYYRNADIETWVPYHKGLPVCDVVKVAIDYKNGQLMIGTFGRGIWMADLYEKSAPDIRITHNGTIVTQGKTLKLVDYSVMSFVPKKYEWRITGNETLISNEQHPEIVLHDLGEYTVSLRVWDENNRPWAKTLKNTIHVQPSN